MSMVERDVAGVEAGSEGISVAIAHPSAAESMEMLNT
jgi:hypothetical protein